MKNILYLYTEEKDKNNYQKELDDLMEVYNLTQLYLKIVKKIKRIFIDDDMKFEVVTSDKEKLKDYSLEEFEFPIGVIVKDKNGFIVKNNPLGIFMLEQYLDWNCKLLKCNN